MSQEHLDYSHLLSLMQFGNYMILNNGNHSYINLPIAIFHIIDTKVALAMDEGASCEFQTHVKLKQNMFRACVLVPFCA